MCYQKINFEQKILYTSAFFTLVNQLTLCSTACLEKLIIAHLVKKLHCLLWNQIVTTMLKNQLLKQNVSQFYRL